MRSDRWRLMVVRTGWRGIVSGEDAEQVGAFGRVHVRRLDHHQQPPGRAAELAGHVLLQRGELDRVQRLRAVAGQS